MSQCTAKSKRSGVQCLKWAVRGKKTCHMHGGKSNGPKTLKGKERSRLAAIKHGEYTKEAFEQYKKARALIRVSQDRLHSFGL